MPSRAQFIRLAYFQRGAEAAGRTLGVSEVYVCPECTKPFTIADLNNDQLTLEHVPPSSVGGHAICLTCRAWNSRAGHTFDYAVAELDKMRAMADATMRHSGEFSGPIRLVVGAATVNANINIEPGHIVIEVHEERNNPEFFHEQMRHFDSVRAKSGTKPQFTITGSFRAGTRPLAMSVLRSAYLAAFAFYGYRYAFDQRLDIVRQQLQEPDREIVPKSAFYLHNEPLPGITEPWIIQTTQPITGVMIHFPKGTFPVAISVMLPPLHATSPFYESLEPHLDGEPGHRKLAIVGNAQGWPTGPAHLLDFPDGEPSA
jgi:hypothetical protein